MRSTTHVACALGISVALVAVGIIEINNQYSNSYLNILYQLFLVGLVSISSLLPDIDHHNSFIGNKVGFNLSWFTKHRGITHSIYPYIFLIVLSHYHVEHLWLKDIVLFVGVGGLLHIFGDMHTKAGVKLFLFGSKYRIFPKKLSFKSGGFIEKTFFVAYLSLLIISIIYMYFL